MSKEGEMASGTPAFRSVSGRQESAEPPDAGNNSNSTTASLLPGKTPSQQRQEGSATPRLRKQPSSHSGTSSPLAGTSPQLSRNTSPARKENRPTSLSSTISTQPSAAAIQRALSAASVPSSGPVSDAVSKLSRASRSVGGGSGDTTPQWPVSPRLKSPPPSTTNPRRGPNMAQKMGDLAASRPPSVNVEAATPTTSTLSPRLGNEEARRPEQQLQAPVKAAARAPSTKSTLETVQENSADTLDPSPAALQASADLKPASRVSDDDESSARRETVDTDKQAAPIESGSESAGNKGEHRRSRRQSPETTNSTTNPAAPKPATKNSYGTLSSAKSRQGDGKQAMTVETETVRSIPQSALLPGARGDNWASETHGSLRMKPSNETIRPNKDRKKVSQKARSITQGTATSKADIFEARVANAVQENEANTSDSDETFVYESNPPDHSQRPRRHHSRTPSVTSAHSTMEQRGGAVRSFGEILDSERRVNGKRSMKFSSNQNDFDSTDNPNGTVRSNRQPRRSRHELNNASTPVQDSPYTQASKLRNSGRFSRSDQPRSPQNLHQQQKDRQHRPPSLIGNKTEQLFDFDGEGADDERTPLVGTVRTPRNGRRGRLNSDSVAAIDEYYNSRQRSGQRSCIRGCCLGITVLVAVVLSATLLLLVWNRPIYDVRVRRLQNVLAAKEEIIFDMLVGAINPNALSVQVPDMDINVFAKSKHVGSADSRMGLLATSGSELTRIEHDLRESSTPAMECTRESCKTDLSHHWHSPGGGVDHGTDPMPGEGDAQTMLLGRVFHFDQPLSFDTSPWSRHLTYSVGELRLMKPGNKTEAGGSARWEKVLQYPFELIVRGVLKYQLPVSTKVQTVAIEASVMVHPEDGIDEFGNMRVEPIDHSEHWDWIDWSEFDEGEDDRLAVEGTARVVEVEVE